MVPTGEGLVSFDVLPSQLEAGSRSFDPSFYFYPYIHQLIVVTSNRRRSFSSS